MKDCIFCKIVKGEVPCYKIYEDDNFLCFLEVLPRTKGHSLLIPKKHYRWTYDYPDFGKYWETVLKITKAMQKALSPKLITYLTHGTDVEHAHIHILPREHETKIMPDIISISKQEMQEIADKIKSNTKSSS